MRIDFKPYSLNIKQKLFTINEPKVMGILNVTDNSFFDGGKYDSVALALKHVEAMLNEGADIIDIGGESTRPGADPVTVDEELKKTMPVIEAIMTNFPDTILSIDTYKSRVALAAVNAGASIVNDISAGDDDLEMYATVGKLGVPFIAMHKKGVPKTMQLNPQYDNIVSEILMYFSGKQLHMRTYGINDVIIDVGFGFGKTLEHNYTLLQSIELFHSLGCPLLVGVSRKGMIWKTLNTTAENALAGTIAANTIALIQGAHILRVHDVKEAKDAIRIVGMMG